MVIGNFLIIFTDLFFFSILLTTSEVFLINESVQNISSQIFTISIFFTYSSGIKVKLSSYKRQVKNPVSNAKVNGNYVHSIVALTEALEAGFDEALMLDADGYIAEGSGENFFIVKDGVLSSPNLDSCLDGITRRTIIELAEELNIPFQVKQLTVQDVLDADESFFSGTAAEVVPINSLDGQSIGTGLRGPITEKLQQTYFDQVRGERDLNSPWLTFTN